MRTGKGARTGRVVGAVNGRGYMQVRIDGKLYRAHRLAFAMMNVPVPEVVDHINGVCTDNRWCNLRAATPAQNSRNRGAQAGRALPKGVYALPSGTFRAVLRTNDGTRHIGTYPTLDAAAKAHRRAAKKLHGEFYHGV